MHILIIGAGLYGCHVATMLKKMNISFKILDKNNVFFSGSSSKNQNRLHQGFHYCRSYYTRKECIQGYNKFITNYDFAVEHIPNNYYFIEKNSIIDYNTYIHIYSHENLEFTEHNIAKLPFKYNHEKFEGNAILTNECYINFMKLKSHFEETFALDLEPNFDATKLIITDDVIEYKNETFTHVIDCTYFQLDLKNVTIPKPDVFYEICVVFLYKQNIPSKLFAMTIMDGPFMSLYPYNLEENIYTLTDVYRTPIMKTSDINVINNTNISDECIQVIRAEVEDNISQYIPSFLHDFTYNGYYLAIKTKPIAQSDDRSLIHIKSENNKIHRFSGGKLTGIFELEEILKTLKD